MSHGSVFVISDTHLGLRDGVSCEPEKLGQFLNWLIHLKNCDLRKNDAKISLGPYDPKGRKRVDKFLKPPDRLILLGDILELWEATDREVELSSRPIFNLLERLDCEKIYVLGNHDYDLLKMSGVYPSGEQQLNIITEYYPSQNDEQGKSGLQKASTLKMGDRDYLFLHGYQFDKSFGGFFHPWKRFGGLRSAALGFGGYADLFVLLFFLGLAIGILNYLFLLFSPSNFFGFNLSLLSSVVSFLSFLSYPGLLIPLGLLGAPRIFYSYGRKIWSKLFGTRYDPHASARGILRWWERFSKRREIAAKNLRIVYGHTHHINVYDLKEARSRKEKIIAERITSERKKPFIAFNIPSWVKDVTSGQKYVEIPRAICLYIDDQDELFIGWDWTKRKPFLVPIDAINERSAKQLAKRKPFVSEATGRKLLRIGWPKKMVNEWTGQSEKK